MAVLAFGVRCCRSVVHLFQLFCFFSVMLALESFNVSFWS